MKQFIISEEEKRRILGMHVEATKRHYSIINEQTENEFTCNSEMINITDSPQIRLTTNQEMGDSKSVTPNILLKNFSTTGGQSRSPILYIRNLRPDGTSTSQQVKKGRANNVATSDNLWLSKIEYVKLIDKTTKKSVYFPSFLTLTHMFCANFKNPESLGTYVDANSAVPGSQVYNYYRLPILSLKATITIDSLVTSGLNVTNFLDNILNESFVVSKLGNIPKKLFGENYQVQSFPRPEDKQFIRKIIIDNQPKTQ